MKRKILSLAFVCFISHGFAQNSLRDVIKGEDGSTKSVVTLTAAQQISFNPVNAKAVFQLDPVSDLVLLKSEKDPLGNTNYRYVQTYQNIPVENSMYVVGVRDGKLREMNGKILLEFSNSFKTVSPSISAPQAIQASMRKVSAQLYAWQDQELENRIKEQTKDANASFAPKATLVWYNPSEEVSPDGMQLCYKVDVYARQPLSRADYFVNASTGEIVGQHDKIHFEAAKSAAETAYSGLRRIISEYNGTDLRLRDYTKGNGVITLHGESGKRGQDYINSTSRLWSFDNQDKAALDAHYGVSQTYSFYWENFGRNSYDGNGTALYSYVNDPTYLDNAFWDGTAMYFNKRSNGDPGGVTAIDVTGHELTHGVTQATSGLIYYKESGAMNESMSDIFGKLVQFWSKPTDISWLLSNDMDWIIRDMANPNATSQPDTYKGRYWYNGIFDNGGVHTNSGVGNFLFYLLVNGGVGTNDNGDAYNVQALGFKRAGNIIYRSNTVKLFPSATYADWREACISSAADLYGESSNEVMQVKNAWHAVGIGDAAVSNIVKAPVEKGTVAISPNPINNGSAQISYTVKTDGNISLKVLGLNGLMMSRIDLGKQLKGDHTYRFNATQLPKGNYVLVLEQDGAIINRTNFLISR